MSDRRRRKSTGRRYPDIAPLTPIDEPREKKESVLQKARRSTTVFWPSSPSSPSSVLKETQHDSDVPPPSPVTPSSQIRKKQSMDKILPGTRAQSLHKTGRQSIISSLGSFRSLHSLKGEKEDVLTHVTSTPTFDDSTGGYNEVTGKQILHHGEVQTAGSVFRKKSQYLVLTDTHLVRFKSQSCASAVFASIPSSLGRSSGSVIRHSRMSSSGSLPETQPSSSGDSIPLNQIVAVYKLDDGKPYFSVEVPHLDEETMHASALTLHLHDPKDSELWLSSIRDAAIKARLSDPKGFSQKLIDYTARAVEQEGDYDPEQMHMFTIVKRATKSGARSSSDDLTKLTSTICILAIGVFKVHLIPLPRSSKTASSTSLSSLNGESYGVASLSSFSMENQDDAFSLAFRIPLRQPSTLFLASCCVTDIALWIRQAADFIRPEWLEQPFAWHVPENLDNELLPAPPSGDEDYQALNRTMSAYCSAYEVDVSRIRYQVTYPFEDAPAFELVSPYDPGQKYNILELLVVMRSLRYNESFGSLSFRNVSLDALQKYSDPYGYEHVPWTTKSGQPLNRPEQVNDTLLVQEVQALALKSRRLRRLDFSNSFKGRSSQMFDVSDGKQDHGCGVCEALFPLCTKQLTNIDWIVLNGIALSDFDIDCIYAAAIDSSSHFRAVDLGSCGLGDRSMQMVLHSLSHQGATMESIDLSGNKTRLDPQVVRDTLVEFQYLRKLNLANISRVSGPEPLISAELLVSWRLEEIRLSKTPLNEETVDAIAVYLQSPQSNTLRLLELDQCRLTGRDAATLFECMVKNPGELRDLQISLNGNRLEHEHEALVKVIRRNKTSSHITMQSLEYKNEREFEKLLNAFAENTTTKYLDLSKTSLQLDAGEDTCQALRNLFARNEVLEYLDISGERAHLEAVSFGKGLNDALHGLEDNQSLKVLRIANQGLGLRGASTLATVIQENRTLEEIYCDGNETSLQGFTILVNSVERNTTLLHLPDMDIDRASSQKTLEKEAEKLHEKESSKAALTSTISSGTKSVKRTLGKTISGQISGMSRDSLGPKSEPKPSKPEFDYQAAQAAVATLLPAWDREVARLHQYLERNHNIRNDLPLVGPGLLDVNRPRSSNSLAKALEAVSSDTTPKAEANAQLGDSTIEQSNEPDVADTGNEGEEGERPLEMTQHSHV